MNVKDQVEIDVRAEKKMFSKLKSIKVNQIFFHSDFHPMNHSFNKILPTLNAILAVWNKTKNYVKEHFLSSPHSLNRKDPAISKSKFFLTLNYTEVPKV